MRLMLLFKKELIESRKSLLIYGITIFLVLLVQEMLNQVSAQVSGVSSAVNAYENSFPGFLLLGGFIMTGVFFAQDMFNRIGQHNWLMLPASPLEKFLAKALVVSIGYPLALALHFMASSLVIEGISALLFSSTFRMFNPFTRVTGMLMLHYLVLQSLFLLGAVYFRKAHFIKTVLALAVISLAMSMIGGIFFRIVFFPYFTGFFTADIMISGNMPDASQTSELFKGLWTYMKVLYWAVLPVFCWIVSYLRVKEVQSTDAVS